MDEICAFVATTFTRQSGGQPRNVLDKYAVAVKKDGNTIIYFVLYILVPLVGLLVPIWSELHLALRPQDTHGPYLFRICVVLSTKLQSAL